MDAREARRLKITRGVVRRMTDPRFRDSLTPDADGGGSTCRRLPR